MVQRLNPKHLHRHADNVNIDGVERPKTCPESYGLVIDVNGEVNICCHDYHRSITFGNILDRSVLDIWFDPEFVRIRKSAAKGIPLTKLCASCLAH